MSGRPPAGPARLHGSRAWAVLLAIGLAAAAGSCSKKNGSGSPVGPSGGDATVSGVVYNLTGGGTPLAGATVSSSPAASVPVTTNAAGQFTLKVPANVSLSVSASKAGFPPHLTHLQLNSGDAQGLSLSLLPIGVSQVVSASSGGRVEDPSAKTVATVPSGYVSMISAFVRVTGLDPTGAQSLAIPGTLAAQDLFGIAANLDPIALANLTVDDGAGLNLALAHSVQLELPIPPARQADVVPGGQVPCFQYDPTVGIWKAFAYGMEATSTITGLPVVKVPVDQPSWVAAGFLDGNTSCVSGYVVSGGAGIPNVDVQAFPGGLTRTNGFGQYQVAVPPRANVQVVAVRVAGGAISTAGASAQADSLGASCIQRNLTLQAGTPLSYVVEAQLVHGRDAIGIVRDQATVKIRVVSPPSLLNGATVQLSAGGAPTLLPAISPGVYGIVSGQNGTLSLQRGVLYSLQLDFESDNVVDAVSQIVMPGGIKILAPAQNAIVDTSFAATWTDDSYNVGGYSALYIGSFESLAFGNFPDQFAASYPITSVSVGDGVGNPALHMTNDPLPSGEYYFHLWATNGPIRYVLPDTTLFTTPNISGSNVTGWFSAISIADSVKIGALGVTP